MKKLVTLIVTLISFNSISQNLFSGHLAGSDPTEPNCEEIEAFNFCIDCASSYREVRELHQLNISDGGGGLGNCMGWMKGVIVGGGDPCLSPSLSAAWYSDDGVEFYFYDQLNWTVTSQSCGGALPISLVSFDGEILNGNSVKLEWVVASQINNDYFTIERSLNLLEWSEIATVSGIGNSSEELTYSTYDENPIEGWNYYRLSQTDYNGDSETFSPIALRIIPNKNFLVKEYNYLGKPIKEGYKGIVIQIWNNGEITKTIKY